MNYDSRRRKKILIADDSELNRELLIDMLEDEYDILEAENGIQALSIIRQYATGLSLILLDIVMPELDGMGVLREMNENGSIERIPVIMISVQNESSYVEQAFELGATDFISRPFDSLIVHRRVVNTILLYAKQKMLVDIAAQQVYEKEKQSKFMIEILSHIVEFRNGESGSHVRRVRVLTKHFLKQLTLNSDRYNFTFAQMDAISIASSLHDIGKIAIPEEILNKPGKLTPDEYEIIKTHAVAGEKILDDLDIQDDGWLIKYACQICRWHHERYDGSGYPDGLVGEEIPIAAQIVALADVYDALTSDRVYRKALSHKTAVEMITSGQCGAFNPLLVKCLMDVNEKIEQIIKDTSQSEVVGFKELFENMMRKEELSEARQRMKIIEEEQRKNDYFAAMTNEFRFEYRFSPSYVSISRFGSNMLGIDEMIREPQKNRQVLERMRKEDIAALSQKLKKTTPDDPMVRYDCELDLQGEKRWFRIMARTIWNTDEKPRCIAVLGKAYDIHDSYLRLHALEEMASCDAMTGLLNHASAKSKIVERFKMHPDGKYALAIFDLDDFKSANDNYGHKFGDKVLVHISKKLKKCIRNTDTVARVGGDEFLVFLEYENGLEPIISRIFKELNGNYKNFRISLSMGVATTDMTGYNYDALFEAADKALYSIKRDQSGQYRFYDSSMDEMFSVISPIDSEGSGDDP